MKKRLLIYIMIFVISVMPVQGVFAGADTTPVAEVTAKVLDNATGLVQVSGQFEGCADEPVGVYVLQSYVESLEGMTPLNAKEYINHTEQLYTNENGEFTFTYKLGDGEGKYKVHAALYDNSMSDDTYFVYVSDGTITSCITTIEDNRDPENINDDLTTRAATVKALFTNNEILNAFDLFEEDMPMSKDFSYIDDEIFKVMVSSESKYDDKDDIKNGILEGVVVKLFNNAEVSEFEGLLDNCKGHIKTLNAEIYKIYKNDPAAKAYADAVLADGTFMSAKSIADAVTEGVTIYKLKQMINYSEFMPFVRLIDNAMGLDLEYYAKIKSPRIPENVDKAIIKAKDRINTLSDLKSAFNGFIKAELDRNINEDGPSAGGGGGMGGGGGAGGIAQSPSISLGDTVGTDFSTEPQKVPSFYDITSVPWAYDSIMSLAKRGVISGYGDGSFKPNNNITREEVVKIIVESFSLLDKEASCDFNDVLSFEWYAGYVASAYNRGVVAGLGNGNFGVGMPVSRQDMAVMVCNVLSMFGKEYPTVRNYNAFSDNAAVAGYAKDAVEKLYCLGIINGSDGNRFNPNNNLTRAEMAKIMSALLEITENM